MFKLQQQPDGRFAIRNIGGRALNDLLSVFDSRREAEEWLLDRSLRAHETDNGLGVMKPGDGQAID